ncbi:MAG: hypothetical protein QXZ20_03710 [Candidatus Aenigmatarchaeota archaeon]
MRKIFLVILFFYIFLGIIFAKDFCKVSLSKIKEVKLKIFYKNDFFEGYIIFYSLDNNPCAVWPVSFCKEKGTSIKPILKIKELNLVKPLDIVPKKFKLYFLDGKLIYAYKIEPFVILGLEKGRGITFKFEWCNLTATDTVFVLD